jgi:hypothetical protein
VLARAAGAGGAAGPASAARVVRSIDAGNRRQTIAGPSLVSEDKIGRTSSTPESPGGRRPGAVDACGLTPCLGTIPRGCRSSCCARTSPHSRAGSRCLLSLASPGWPAMASSFGMPSSASARHGTGSRGSPLRGSARQARARGIRAEGAARNRSVSQAHREARVGQVDLAATSRDVQRSAGRSVSSYAEVRVGARPVASHPRTCGRSWSGSATSLWCLERRLASCWGMASPERGDCGTFALRCR